MLLLVVPLLVVVVGPLLPLLPAPLLVATLPVPAAHAALPAQQPMLLLPAAAAGQRATAGCSLGWLQGVRRCRATATR